MKMTIKVSVFAIASIAVLGTGVGVSTLSASEIEVVQTNLLTVEDSNEFERLPKGLPCDGMTKEEIKEMYGEDFVPGEGVNKKSRNKKHGEDFIPGESMGQKINR